MFFILNIGKRVKFYFFFSSRRRHTRLQGDWSSDVCSSDLAAWVREHPARLVLLGAHPTGPEVEYGWIELGRPLDSTDDRQMWEVRRFWEKPSEEQARLCLEAGCLWNTLVLVGTATMFLRAAREAVPEVCERLAQAMPFFETDAEAWAQAYALIPRADFSRAILEPCHLSWPWR